MLCEFGGMSRIRTAYMDDDIHASCRFLYNSFRHSLSFFRIEKEAFAGTAADIHLLDTLAAEIVNNGFSRFQVNITILIKRCVEGNSNVFEFVDVIL